MQGHDALLGMIVFRASSLTSKRSERQQGCLESVINFLPLCKAASIAKAVFSPRLWDDFLNRCIVQHRCVFVLMENIPCFALYLKLVFRRAYDCFEFFACITIDHTIRDLDSFLGHRPIFPRHSIKCVPYQSKCNIAASPRSIKCMSVCIAGNILEGDFTLSAGVTLSQYWWRFVGEWLGVCVRRVCNWLNVSLEGQVGEEVLEGEDKRREEKTCKRS